MKRAVQLCPQIQKFHEPNHRERSVAGKVKSEPNSDVKAELNAEHPNIKQDPDIKFDPDSQNQVKPNSSQLCYDRYDRKFSTVPQGTVLPPHLRTVDNPGNMPAGEEKTATVFECAWDRGFIF